MEYAAVGRLRAAGCVFAEDQGREDPLLDVIGVPPASDRLDEQAEEP